MIFRYFDGSLLFQLCYLKTTGFPLYALQPCNWVINIRGFLKLKRKRIWGFDTQIRMLHPNRWLQKMHNHFCQGEYEHLWLLEECDDFLRTLKNVGLTINLLTGDALHMDNPLTPVDLDHLSFTSFVCASHNLDLIILPHWNRPNLKFAKTMIRSLHIHPYNIGNKSIRSSVELDLWPYQTLPTPIISSHCLT